MSWATGWLAWDDEALAALSNKGVVRRAQKAVAEASLVEEGAGAVVSTGGMRVTLGPGGPAEARCPCPATGACVHIVTAAMLARELPVTDGATPVAPLAELRSVSPEQWCRDAGAAAVRVALRAARSEADVEAREDGSALLISWTGGPTVTYSAGQSLAGMSSPTPRAGWPALHLEAVARAYGADWVWPARFVAEAEEADRLDEPVGLLEETRAGLGALLHAGLADVSPMTLRSLGETHTRLRAARLPRLAGLLGALIGQVEALAKRVDSLDEGSVLEAIGRCWALTEALPHGWPAELSGRRDAREGGDLDLVALGATWWQSESGARGLTVHLWDVAGARSLRLSDGRGAGMDPSFTRTLAATRPWDTALRTLLGARFTLPAAQLRADGSLAPTGPRATDLRPATEADLDLACAPQLSRVSVDPFTAGSGAARLIRVARLGTLTVDETAQCLVLPVESPDGATAVLRAPATPAHRVRIERLEHLAGHAVRVEYLLAVPTVHQGRRCLDPVAVFVRGKRGLQAVSLDFEGAVEPTRQNSWLRRRLALLTDRRSTPPPAGAVDRLISDAQRVATDIGVLGVGRPMGLESLPALAARAEDLALAELGRVLRDLARTPSPDALMRVVVLIGMVRELSWGQT